MVLTVDGMERGKCFQLRKVDYLGSECEDTMFSLCVGLCLWASRTDLMGVFLGIETARFEF